MAGVSGGNDMKATVGRAPVGKGSGHARPPTDLSLMPAPAPRSFSLGTPLNGPDHLLRKDRRRPASDTIFDPETFLAKAGLGRTIVNLSKKQVLFSQGQPADTIYYLQKGKVKITVVATNGKEATIALLGEGEFVGES